MTWGKDRGAGQTWAVNAEGGIGRLSSSAIALSSSARVDPQQEHPKAPHRPTSDRQLYVEMSDRGAALIEMALVLPLLLMLLFGIVSTGVAYNHQLSLTHAAREAGRWGATLPVTNYASMDAWLAAVEERSVQSATGSLAPGTPGLYVCIAYVYPNGVSTTDQTSRIVNGTVTTGATCFADGRPDDERRVQVHVMRDVDFNALVFQRALTLDSEGVNRFEAALGF